jgi:nickel-dependent lactate racemase
VQFKIPEEQLLYEITGNNRPSLPDLSSAYLQALDHPIDAPPLKEIVKPNDTVAITVSDITRFWQKNASTLSLLIDYLNQVGVPDSKITVIIAVGNHRLNTEAEFVEICSQTVCHRIKVVNYVSRDMANMVYLGKTSRGTEEKNGTESAFPLDRSIIGLLYKTNACENMNKLRSGRPWLGREAKNEVRRDRV